MKHFPDKACDLFIVLFKVPCKFVHYRTHAHVSKNDRIYNKYKNVRRRLEKLLELSDDCTSISKSFLLRMTQMKMCTFRVSVQASQKIHHVKDWQTKTQSNVSQACYFYRHSPHKHWDIYRLSRAVYQMRIRHQTHA
jgi:hypothetical protein